MSETYSFSTPAPFRDPFSRFGDVQVFRVPAPGTVGFPGHIPYPMGMPGYERLPTPQNVALYEHLCDASYTPAFDDVRMHRVLPVFLYLGLSPDPQALFSALQSLGVLLNAFEYDVVLEYPDLGGSLLKKLLVRSRDRRTRSEMDEGLTALAHDFAASAAAAFPAHRISHIRPRPDPPTPKTTVRDVVGLQKDRAEIEKLKAERWEKRGSAISHFTQALKHLMIGASVTWFLVVDGQTVGGDPDAGGKETVRVEQVEPGSAVDLAQRLSEAKSPDDVRKIIEEFRRGPKTEKGSQGGDSGPGKQAPGPGARRK